MKIQIKKGGLGMGTWNHRVILHKDRAGPYFAIHEVYYNNDGKVRAWTDEPKAAGGENTSELRENLGRMLRALEKPVLTVVKRGKRKTLVEMKPGGKQPRGTAVCDLPDDQRDALESLKSLIEGEVNPNE